MKWSMTTMTLFALCSAGSLSAQGIPALGAAKAAANRAVDATNAHTHEETGQAITPRKVNPANPSASPAASQPAPKPAAGAGKPAASGKPPAEAPATTTLSREVFSYDGSGRRDPFLSLLATGELRPAFNDLKLVAVAYDPTGRKSVAVMRDISTKDQ